GCARMIAGKPSAAAPIAPALRTSLRLSRLMSLPLSLWKAGAYSRGREAGRRARAYPAPVSQGCAVAVRQTGPLRRLAAVFPGIPLVASAPLRHFDHHAVDLHHAQQ